MMGIVGEKDEERGRIYLTVQHKDFERGIFGSRGGHCICISSGMFVALVAFAEKLKDWGKNMMRIC